ncbi:GNAT family N-acetyltransferase [Muriicola sp.]|uniref:GNAT family N-acetyltransferase n=1 Tax=Muriicola sp. TaxID=2020856 RepID=UPI003C70F76B
MLDNLLNTGVFDQFPVLKTNRLHLRELNNAYTPSFYTLRSDKKVLKFMDTGPLENMMEAEKMIQENVAMYQRKEGLSWAITDKEHERFMGYCTFWKLDTKNARSELGFAMLPEKWGQGYMEEALKAVIEFAFRQWQLHSIEANINPLNERSRQLLIKQGFRKEGYFKENFWYNGQFLDSAIYSLLEKWRT